MAKKRVHELAKELAIGNKELLEILKSKNIEVKSHMSSVEESVADEIRKTHQTGSGKEEPAKKVSKKAETAKKETAKKETAGKTTQKASASKKVASEGKAATSSKEAASKDKTTTSSKETTSKEKAVTSSKEATSKDKAAASSKEVTSEEKATASAPEAKKSKNIVRVFRPQNTKRGLSPGGQQGQGKRPPGQRPGQAPRDGRAPRPAANQRPERVAGSPRPSGETPRAPRPTPSGSPRPSEGETPRPRTDKTTRPASPVNNQGQGSRPSGSGTSQGGAGQRTRPSGSGNNQNQGGVRVNQNQGGQRTRPGGGTNQNQGGQRGRPGEQGNNQGQRGQRSHPAGPRSNQGQSGGGRPGQRSDAGSREQTVGGATRRGKDSPIPVQEQQKPHQRGKAKDKDKEKDLRKQEGRDGTFDNKNRKGKKQKPAAEVQKPQPKVVKKEEQIKQIILPEVLTIKELADKMKLVPSVIVKKLFLQGKAVTLNQEIDFDTAEEIAMEFNVLCEKEVVIDVIEELLEEKEEDVSTMEKRPPVVCVMGHVDHGKTSLLDAIRDANVMGREAGGITQHIGAYTVQVNGENITFLDTPGHEAFTAMRMRGATSTDIAILVVAADDGVMPQTIEAISHAKAAGVEIIVAINKIDKPGANVERVKQELTEHELIPEDWGGSTVFVPVSAKTKDGIKDLLEMIILTSEVLELKANPNRSARGLVIEGLLDKGKGSVATVLVQKGTLRVGDSIAAGSAYGKVRAMMDDKGRRVKVAGLSMPVEILGLNGVPNAGEVFVGCETEKDARSFAETFISHNRVRLLDDTKSKMSLDDLFTQIHDGNLKELNLIVKADVQGSVEALKESLVKLSNEEVVVKVIHGGVGAINESDVILASTSNSIIIGFNVRPDVTAKEIADREGVDLRLYRVIYKAIEDVEAAMKGMLDPIYEEKILGHAEIRQVFKASGIGNIAGSYVLDGIMERGCKVRITRDGTEIFHGDLASLKRFKDDVKEVRAGYECGLVFADFNDVREEDKVEAYKMVEVERK